MTEPETRLDYSRRVAWVTDHIADNFDADLGFERLAAVAFFAAPTAGSASA